MGMLNMKKVIIIIIIIIIIIMITIIIDVNQRKMGMLNMMKIMLRWKKKEEELEGKHNKHV